LYGAYFPTIFFTLINGHPLASRFTSRLTFVGATSIILSFGFAVYLRRRRTLWCHSDKSTRLAITSCLNQAQCLTAVSRRVKNQKPQPGCGQPQRLSRDHDQDQPQYMLVSHPWQDKNTTHSKSGIGNHQLSSHRRLSTAQYRRTGHLTKISSRSPPLTTVRTQINHECG
jgi:hypothetical protein